MKTTSSHRQRPGVRTATMSPGSGAADLAPGSTLPTTVGTGTPSPTPQRGRCPVALVAYAVCALVLTTGCASLFRGYDPGALSPEYRQAFKEAMRVRPTKDSADYWQTPDETRTRGKGDCEDLAFLLEDEARRQGLAAPVEFGKAHVSNKTFHAWNEVRTPDGRRIVMDAFLGVWMVDPRPGYYVKYDMAKTDHAVGFLVNGLDYSLRKGGNAGPSQTFASAN